MNKPVYECAVCKARLETEAELHTHERMLHNPQEDAQARMEAAGGAFPCPECGVQMETPETLEEHLVGQHPERSGMGQIPIQKRRGSKGTF